MLQKQKKLRDEGKGEQMTKYFFKKGQQFKKKKKKGQQKQNMN